MLFSKYGFTWEYGMEIYFIVCICQLMLFKTCSWKLPVLGMLHVLHRLCSPDFHGCDFWLCGLLKSGNLDLPLPS